MGENNFLRYSGFIQISLVVFAGATQIPVIERIMNSASGNVTLEISTFNGIF